MRRRTGIGLLGLAILLAAGPASARDVDITLRFAKELIPANPFVRLFVEGEARLCVGATCLPPLAVTASPGHETFHARVPVDLDAGPLTQIVTFGFDGVRNCVELDPEVFCPAEVLLILAIAPDAPAPEDFFCPDPPCSHVPVGLVGDLQEPFEFVGRLVASDGPPTAGAWAVRVPGPAPGLLLLGGLALLASRRRRRPPPRADR